MTRRPLGKRAVDGVVCAIVAVVAALVGLAPWSWLSRIGAAIGWLAGSVLRVRRREVAERLAAAGFATDAQRVYRSLGISLTELLWVDRRTAPELVRHVTLTHRAERALAMARERGAVVATAHLGSWDLVACRVAAEAPLVVLTKRLSNAGLDRRWQQLRARKGVSLVGGEGALTTCLSALRERRVVALMIDQAPEHVGSTVELPFLGQRAFHDLGPALLAARARVPLIVAWGTRMPDGSHVIDAPVVIEPPARASRVQAIAATRTAAAALEAEVRAHPDQWLWLHRRWKQPAPRGTRAPWTTSFASAPGPSARGSSWAPASTRT